MIELLSFLTENIFRILLILIPLIIVVAYLTYAERKIIAFIQLRKGPNVLGFAGLLQPIADTIKLIFKEFIIPIKADKILFLMAPIITFVCSVIGWAVIPTGSYKVISNINLGVLYILAVSSFSVYGIIIAGWSSNSEYAFLGAIRSAAQMISYEINVALTMLTAVLAYGSLNLSEIVHAQQNIAWWIKLLLFPMCISFFISILAETNRLPFDMAEAESELVAGYHVEYSATGFALFFLGEYANMILTSSMLVILFWGGWLPIVNIKFLSFIPPFAWLIIKILFILFIFIWIRATFPRYRYDQLMGIGWKKLLPLNLFWFILVFNTLFIFDKLP